MLGLLLLIGAISLGYLAVAADLPHRDQTLETRPGLLTGFGPVNGSIVDEFVAALNDGDVATVARLMDPDPTVLQWPIVLRSAQVPFGATAEEWAQLNVGLESGLEHFGCISKARTMTGAVLYDEIVTCFFVGSDALARHLELDGYRGNLEFGVRGGRIRGIFVTDPAGSFLSIDDYKWWIETQRGDLYERWSPDVRIRDAIGGEELAAALLHVAPEYRAWLDGHSFPRSPGLDA
jgi:hypothetical protein